VQRRKVTPAGLTAALERLTEQTPELVRRSMGEAATALEREAAGDSTQPVDQGDVKGGWTSEPTADGFRVSNRSEHAVWVERGRGPGPVPFGAILAWVKRKGIARAQAKTTAKAQGRRASKDEVTQAEKSAAAAIQKKIEREGIEPRWVLRRAVERLRSKMGGILRRAVGGLKP
jgi:hypothetical protein